MSEQQREHDVACYFGVCACRHPASGYVQGINDLVTPFLAVFLSPHMEGSVGDESETEFLEEVSNPFITLHTYCKSSGMRRAKERLIERWIKILWTGEILSSGLQLALPYCMTTVCCTGSPLLAKGTTRGQSLQADDPWDRIKPAFPILSSANCAVPRRNCQIRVVQIHL